MDAPGDRRGFALLLALGLATAARAGEISGLRVDRSGDRPATADWIMTLNASGSRVLPAQNRLYLSALLSREWRDLEGTLFRPSLTASVRGPQSSLQTRYSSFTTPAFLMGRRGDLDSRDGGLTWTREARRGPPRASPQGGLLAPRSVGN